MNIRHWMVVASLAFATSTVRAQVDIEDQEFGGDVPTDDLGFGDDSDFEGPQAGGAVEPRLGETHAVRPGDTLWDLSSEYLNNAWYWPKVWSYNPQLTNPHWIFPGNEVRFYPSDENLPTAVDVASSELEVPDDDLTIPGQVDDADLVRTIGGIQTQDDMPDTVWSAFTGFIATGTGRFTGQITAADTETVQLSRGDRVYLQVDEALAEGQEVYVFRRRRPVLHPITGEQLGWAIEVMGSAQVERLTPTVTVARITRSYGVIERGDYVGQMPSYYGQRVGKRTNEVDTDGYIVESVGDVVALIGEHHFVYLDRGRADGVQIGNTLRVLDRGDNLTGQIDGLPWEQIGQVMVIDVQEEASTAVVTNSIRRLSVGDRVQMIAGR